MSVMLVFKDHEGDNFMLSFPAAENKAQSNIKKQPNRIPRAAHLTKHKEVSMVNNVSKRPAAPAAPTVAVAMSGGGDDCQQLQQPGVSG